MVMKPTCAGGGDGGADFLLQPEIDKRTAAQMAQVERIDSPRRILSNFHIGSELASTWRLLQKSYHRNFPSFVII
jgi:hypothetical protein